jgi:hypothetical protein
LILKYIECYPNIASRELAKILGFTYGFVRERRRRPALRFALQMALETTDTHLERAANKAARRLIELIDHPNPAISLAAVKIALTRYLENMPSMEDKIVAYRSTIDPDGKLLQEIVKEEIRGHIIDATKDELE